MFERRIQNQLHEWAEKNNRKPLILRGARQEGKTTIVEQFGKEFDNFLSLNLEKKEAKDLFESTDDVKMLLPLLFLYDNKPQRPGRTLLFIDEIQSSPQAVALLRYFYEELPELYVIAAGSLLENMLDKHISLPVIFPSEYSSLQETIAKPINSSPASIHLDKIKFISFIILLFLNQIVILFPAKILPQIRI